MREANLLASYLLPLISYLSFHSYTVPMIVDNAKLANPIMWTAG